MWFKVTRYDVYRHELVIGDASIEWRRLMWVEDMDELAERVRQACVGVTPEPMHDWRDDPEPDEDLADRDAPVFQLAPDPEHPHGWMLAIGDGATTTFRLRAVDLSEFASTITTAID